MNAQVQLLDLGLEVVCVLRENDDPLIESLDDSFFVLQLGIQVIDGLNP